jgi:mono/diheme cytochrome c family protein
VVQNELADENPSRVSALLIAACLAAIVVGTVDLAGTPQAAHDGAVESGGPTVPGLHGNHPLDERGVGAVLISELGCASCHSQMNSLAANPKLAPDLQEVGARVSPEFLRKFLQFPSTILPGTTMPHMLDGLPTDERGEAAEAITQFLVSRASTTIEREPLADSDVALGGKLFHSVGCIACHSPREAATQGGSVPSDQSGSVVLAHTPEKYSLASLADFLYDPLTVRPSGRMPDMGLSRAEARSIASYLLAAPTINFAPAATEFPLAAKGREYFQKLNCASCHALDGIPAAEPVQLNRELVGTEGCLSPQPPAGVPDFKLTAEQRASIRVALSVGDVPVLTHDALARTLTTFNCIACHERDDYGGVPPEVNAYFQSSEPALGNEARIPPQLTDLGAKLNPDWLEKVLFEGGAVRPHMHTRMPQFGELNLAALPELIEAADPAPPIEIPVFRGKQRGEMHTAAQQLLGSDMLACINCHTFNGKASPAFSGIDLTTTAERLQPAWFKAFLIDPQAHRPGIIMPQSWPGGEAQRTDVLEGDTDAQIDAIWSYLEQGRTARDPKGIRSEPTIVKVSDAPRTYRGRSGIAGFRGIAVGYPGGLNYAFNAENGAFSGIWRGDFVRVRWDGQGAGDFNPAARAISLAQDVGFARLQDANEAWPLKPVMTEEQPINPDPLYPRRLGYQFRGYQLDAGQVPNLLYRMGSLAIEDRTSFDSSSESGALVRAIHFDSPAADALYFRALTGEIEELSSTQFQVGNLRLTVPAGIARVRPMTGNEQASELLLQLEIPQGKSKIEIRYEVL